MFPEYVQYRKKSNKTSALSNVLLYGTTSQTGPNSKSLALMSQVSIATISQLCAPFYTVPEWKRLPDVPTKTTADASTECDFPNRRISPDNALPIDQVSVGALPDGSSFDEYVQRQAITFADHLRRILTDTVPNIMNRELLENESEIVDAFADEDVIIDVGNADDSETSDESDIFASGDN